MKIKKIIIIDDDLDYMNGMDELLSEKNYVIIKKNNTEDILDFVKYNKPDLIILDMKVNGLTGMDVAKLLKNDPKTNGLPIMLITNNCTEDIDKDKYGINICLDKSIKPEIFFAELERIEKEQYNT